MDLNHQPRAYEHFRGLHEALGYQLPNYDQQTRVEPISSRRIPLL